MLLMGAASIRRASGRGLGPGNQSGIEPVGECHLGPKNAYRLDAISQTPKNSRFPGPNPLPLALVKDAACIKSITHGAV